MSAAGDATSPVTTAGKATSPVATSPVTNAGEESLAHCPATNGRIPRFNCNGDSGDRGTLHRGNVAHTVVWHRTCGYGVVHGCGVDGYRCGICQTNPRCHPCRSLGGPVAGTLTSTLPSCDAIATGISIYASVAWVSI